MDGIWIWIWILAAPVVGILALSGMDRKSS